MSSETIIIIIQYAAIATLFFEMLYAILQRPSILQVHAVILTIATMLMFVGYNIEIKATNIEQALTGASVSYMGKPFIMLESFLLICEFFGKKVPKWLKSALSIGCLAFPIILFTNKYHHLYYATEAFDINQAYTPLILTKGPLYYSYVITSVLFFLSCAYIIVSDIIKNRNKKKSKRKKMITLLSSLMIVSGMAGYAVYLADLTNNYDSTMLGVFGGVVCLFFIFVKFNIFDAVTIAKEHALDDASVGLAIYDDSDKKVYTNDVADILLAHKDIRTLVDGFESEGEFMYAGKIYSVNKKNMNFGSVYVGRSIEFNDITYAKNYQTKLEAEVRERTEKIEHIQKGIIASVADMVESRSLETGDHIKRTSAYTELIANALVHDGKYTDILTPEYIDTMVMAAPLHDIGKISIPDAILLKPGKLTPEEFEKMKEHSANGAIMISKAMRGVESPEFCQMAEDIAKYHHEKWDGKGYPEHLSGTDIPLSARIVALADCFDALTSERCYKPAFTIDEAMRIINEEKGTHFAPDVVDAFIGAVKREGEQVLTVTSGNQSIA